MIKITLPDQSVRQLESGLTGADIAALLSKSLAKKAVAMRVDGVLCDLSDPLTKDVQLEIITRTDPEALELIRHDAAHVMAEAVQELWPDTQVTIGPVIENGFYYDFDRTPPFTEEDLPIIEAKMREIIARNAPFTKEIWGRAKARDFFKERGELYKVALVDAIPEGETLKIYRQGTWLDLCRGPHMVSTGQIGTAFKLMKVAGAYWRGKSDNPMLTRIYGTAWAAQAQLEAYLTQLEEAEKRDHRRLGREMDLFHFHETGPGVVFWHPKGWTLFQTLIAYMRRRLQKEGYQEVNAPQILDKALWELSGHWEWYQEHMFLTQTEDERVFAIKPMNCPGHLQIFAQGVKSYRDLPVRLSEFGVVSRYEPSGALHGLLRVRAFTQDDAHVFCTPEQLAEECLKINTLILSTYADFGFDKITVKLSTRPEKRVGSDALWDEAEAVMRDVLERIKAEGGDRVSIGVNPGEGAFYGPKFEYVLRDAIGRAWQCGTTQIDFNLPERFGISYTDRLGQKKQPVMIHRAIFGSMERFLGILIENYAGHLPLWLAPLQIVVTTITSDADPYAQEITSALQEAGLRAACDTRNEKITYKIRNLSLSKIPVILVCGQREAEEKTVSLRRLGTRHSVTLPFEDVLTSLVAEALPPDLRSSTKRTST